MRTLHPPTQAGLGDGRVVYFLGAHSGVEADVASLADQGYTVVVDAAPTRRTLREALYGQDPELEGHSTVALSWSGPGARDGSLQLTSGEWVSPECVEPAFVTHELEWVAFAGCHTGRHRGIWQGRLGEHVKVVARRESRSAAAELIRASLLPGGGGAGSVPDAPEDWEDETFDPGPLTFVDDPDEDTWWSELFALVRPQLARTIEEQLGLSTRQYVWRVGELLAAAAIHQLQGDAEKAAERHVAASAAGQLLTGTIPPLFEGSGDVAQALTYLTHTIPRCALGRGVHRLGADHAALLDGSLQLLLLALPPQVSDPVRDRLRALGAEAGLQAKLWDGVLSSSGRELFASAHQRVFDALAGERKPRHVTRALAFGLGRRLALGSTMNMDEDPEAAETLLSCQDMAAVLKIDVPPKLERLGRYPSVVETLRRKHGPDHASLFVLATQLIALRYGYDPLSPETTYRLMKRLNQARKRARVKRRLFRALATVEDGTAPRSTGSELVNQTLQAISEHLMTELD